LRKGGVACTSWAIRLSIRQVYLSGDRTPHARSRAAPSSGRQLFAALGAPRRRPRAARCLAILLRT